MSSALISVWPSWALRCSGVNPALLSEFGPAPYSSRVFAMSIWFFLAAMCSGVWPFLADAWGDAPWLPTRERLRYKGDFREISPYLIQKEQGHVLVVVVRSNVQRRHAVLPLSVNRSLLLQEQLRDVHVTVFRSQVQRGEAFLCGCVQ